MSKLSKAIAVLGVVAGLGVAALPLSSYAATSSKDVAVTAIVDETISLAITEGTSVSLSPNLNAENVAKGSITATVTTNVKEGYTLSLMGKEGDTTMKAVTGNGDAIPTVGSGNPVEAGKSAWGYNTTGAEATYNAIPSTATDIKAKGTDTSTTTIYFGASASADQAAGTYTGNVTITATANVSAD